MHYVAGWVNAGSCCCHDSSGDCFELLLLLMLLLLLLHCSTSGFANLWHSLAEDSAVPA
jgi:hypothetical protein